MTTFDIPEAMIAAYRGKPVIVRTHDPRLLVAGLMEEDLEHIAYIRVCDLSSGLRPLIDWAFAGPVEVVLEQPGTEFPELYKLTELVRACPVRVSIAVAPGFLKAVRVAASLHCAIKLDLGQPSPVLIPELLEALEFYLHGSGVTEPIEFFHSLLAAFCQGQAVSLWDIQEDNPAAFRYVTDDGRVTLPGRLSVLLPDDVIESDGQFEAGRFSTHPECAHCSFFGPCGGYFKWPNRDYACDGMKDIFRRLEDAAHTLSQDLSEHQSKQELAGS